MAEQRTPRQMVKALVRGEALSRPLLLPVVFALGSRLQNCSLRGFQENPTKIANALRQIRSTLKIDGLTCYWDPLLELEALADGVEWKSGGSAIIAAGANAGSISRNGLRQRREEAGGILKIGRVQVAVEALQRLKVMSQDEPALMVRVTGPHELARQLTTAIKLSADSSADDMLEFAADVTASLVRGYLEAGADIIFLAEKSLPTKSVGDFERWRTVLDPVVNAIRFFEALPVLSFEDAIGPKDMALVRGHSWDCAICSLLQGESALDWQGVAPWLGMSMPGLDVARSEQECGEWATSILGAATALQASFLTSPDLPASIDLKSLTKNLSSIRGHLVSAA